MLIILPNLKSSFISLVLVPVRVLVPDPRFRFQFQIRISWFSIRPLDSVSNQ